MMNEKEKTTSENDKNEILDCTKEIENFIKKVMPEVIDD